MLSPGRTLTRAPSEQQCMAGSCSKDALLSPVLQTAFFLLEPQPAVGVMLGFPCRSTVKNDFKTIDRLREKYVIQLGWFNAARPE